MKLTYEDCKQLKDAGFPQEGDGNYILYEDDTEWSVNKEHPDGAYRPTLSELIEACGEKFGALIKAQLKKDVCFMAVTKEEFDKIGQIKDRNTNPIVMMSYTGYTGSSTEQAVKNLWIALNNNQS